MISTNVEAHVHFRHSDEEVRSLATAIIPMAEAIARCSKGDERASMHRVTGCRYFRRHEAYRMQLMLLRSVKFARAHLDEYFESMRQEILVNAQNLENATKAYWARFEAMLEDTIPTH